MIHVNFDFPLVMPGWEMDVPAGLIFIRSARCEANVSTSFRVRKAEPWVFARLDSIEYPHASSLKRMRLLPVLGDVDAPGDPDLVMGLDVIHQPRQRGGAEEGLPPDRWREKLRGHAGRVVGTRGRPVVR